MTIEIPDNWLGEPIKGSIERLEDSPEQEVLKGEQRLITPASANITGKDQYIILEGRQHGNYSYPDILVAMDRTHQNTNWSQAWDALRNEDAFMLTIRQYVDFLNVLKSGKAYDGNGTQIPDSRLTELFNDITQIKSPWRREWLDAKFKNVSAGRTLGVIPKNELHISYHVLDNGGQRETSEKLDDCLMGDKTPGISMNYWLANATDQGLPQKNNDSGQLYYWHPRNGRVARFGASSGRAGLNCGGDPDDRYASLGVRAVRRADAKN